MNNVMMTSWKKMKTKALVAKYMGRLWLVWELYTFLSICIYITLYRSWAGGWWWPDRSSIEARCITPSTKDKEANDVKAEMDNDKSSKNTGISQNYNVDTRSYTIYANICRKGGGQSWKDRIEYRKTVAKRLS